MLSIVFAEEATKNWVPFWVFKTIMRCRFAVKIELDETLAKYFSISSILFSPSLWIQKGSWCSLLVQPRARNLLPQTTSMYETLLAPSFSSLPTPMAPVRPTLFITSFFGRGVCVSPTTTGSYSSHLVSHFKWSSGTGNFGFWPGKELRESRHLSAQGSKLKEQSKSFQNG